MKERTSANSTGTWEEKEPLFGNFELNIPWITLDLEP
jgi:hypothetical protein